MFGEDAGKGERRRAFWPSWCSTILEEEHFNGLEGGYNSFLDKLEELLAKA